MHSKKKSALEIPSRITTSLRWALMWYRETLKTLITVQKDIMSSWPILQFHTLIITKMMLTILIINIFMTILMLMKQTKSMKSTMKF